MIVSNAKTNYVLFYHLEQFAIKLAQRLYEIPVQQKLDPPLIRDFVAPYSQMVSPDNELALDFHFYQQHLPTIFHPHK